MSGGVDSAVTLLRSGAARRRRDAPSLARSGRPGLRARVLLAVRGDRGADAVPFARAASRDARPTRGVPARRRRAVRARLRARGDAEPVHPLQRRLPLRGAPLVRTARRRGAARDRPLRAHRRARRADAARASRRSGEGPELHARAPRSAPPRARLVPARHADEVGDARRGGRGRARRRRPAPRARRRASSRAATTGRSSSGTALQPRRVRSSTRQAPRSASTTATGGSRLGSAAGSASPLAEPLYALETHAATNTVVVGPREALARRTVTARGRLFAPVDEGRGEAPLPLARGGRERRADGDRLPPAPRRARVRRRPWTGGRSVRRGRGRRFRVGHVRDPTSLGPW